MDVSGLWRGHYVQHLHGAPGDDFYAHPENHFPIEAYIVQNGDQISGTMVDLGSLEHVERFREAFDRMAAGMDKANQLEWQIFLARHPRCMVSRTLPKTSHLAGACVGDRVEFIKTYDGPQITRFFDALFSSSFEQPAIVTYRGRANEFEALLTGDYWLHDPNQPGSPLVRGGVFELWRVTD